MNTRAIAARFIINILDKKYSLLTLNDKLSQAQVSNQNRPFIKLLCYEFFRNYFFLEKTALNYINNKTKLKVKTLVMLGLLELLKTNQPHYATINETVNACKNLKTIWATKLINGTLRSILKNIQQIKLEYLEYNFIDLPKWLIDITKTQYPQSYIKITKDINVKANIFIRINNSKNPETIIRYFKENNILYSSTKVTNCFKLENTINILDSQLFQSGYFTIQDISAQYAGWIINPQNNDNILDACAAPGGKTTHILELNSKATITAVDIIDRRIELLRSNLKRINANNNVKIIKHDLTKYFKGKFNKIIFDAPCSAVGTIKRNPDIKILRKSEDIENIQNLQQQILQNLWNNNLEENGWLLYITCSILKQENQDQIKQFLTKNSDVKIMNIELLKEYKTDIGYQLLPFKENGDGFYYCLMKKIPKSKIYT